MPYVNLPAVNRYRALNEFRKLKEKNSSSNLETLAQRMGVSRITITKQFKNSTEKFYKAAEEFIKNHKEAKRFKDGAFKTLKMPVV